MTDFDIRMFSGAKRSSNHRELATVTNWEEFLKNDVALIVFLEN
jgi:hypothetical protein